MSPKVNFRRILASEASQTLRKRHSDQIGKRDRKLDVMMSGLAAMNLTFGPSDLTSPSHHLLNIGSVTYFSMRQHKTIRRGPPDILLAGYKAYVEEGVIKVGFARGNVCAYDFRGLPMAAPGPRSKVISVRKLIDCEIGFRMDDAIRMATADPSESVQPCLLWPQFWCGFRPENLPEVEDCPAARKIALQYAREGWMMPSMRARGGTVTVLARDDKEGLMVGWDGTADEPREVQVLPKCTVLRPFAKEGVTIEAGAPLGDFMPRRLYPNWHAIVEAVGQETADCLLAETVLSSDENFKGLVCRRIEYCSADIPKATQVFEDVRDLLDDNQEGLTQVISNRNEDLFRGEGVDGKVQIDLCAIRQEWTWKFE